MMPPPQKGQMPMVIPGGFPGVPGPVAGAGRLNGGPGASGPGSFPAGGGPSTTMPPPQKGQMPMVIPGGFPGGPGPVPGGGRLNGGPGASGPGSFTAGGGPSTMMPPPQKGQMPMVIPGGFPGGPGPVAGAGRINGGPGANAPGSFTAGGGPSTIDNMPKPQSGQLPNTPGGFPGPGAGSGSQVSRPGGFPGGPGGFPGSPGSGANAPQPGGYSEGANARSPATGGVVKPPIDAATVNDAALPNRAASIQATNPWSTKEGPGVPSRSTSNGLPASPTTNRDNYAFVAPSEANGKQATTAAPGNSANPSRSFQPVRGSQANYEGSFNGAAPNADRISPPKSTGSYAGSTPEASTTRYAPGAFTPGSRSNQVAQSQDSPGTAASDDDTALRSHPAERYEEEFDMNEWIENGKAWFGVQGNLEKAFVAVAGTAAALTIGFSSKMQLRMPVTPPDAMPVVQESVQIQSTALPKPLPPLVQQVQDPKPIIQSNPQPSPTIVNPINEATIDGSSVEVRKPGKVPPSPPAPVTDRPAAAASGKEPQLAVSEERLEAFMERLQARYDDLGLKLEKKELTLLDESIQQLAQAQAQKAIAEDALIAIKDAKSRLAAEKGRLDMALDEAKLLYARLGEQSMLQLLNVQKQLKKAEESLQAAAETRAAFDASLTKPAAEKSMDLEDVQRVYSERESQVRSSMALLEEDSEKQVVRVQAQLEAAEQSLDSVLGEKARLEVQQAELNKYVENVDKRYEQLIRQAELRLQVDEANVKVAERVLKAVTEPGSYKLQ
jgi:hypothetical protein